MTNGGARLEAYFFGDAGRQLYGAFHEPSGSAEQGVVLAYPGPQEYMPSHYAFRLLAAQLAREGFAVLRFDWRGTGDSAGESVDINFQQYREDLQSAVQELIDVSGVRRVSVVGFRLGANMAASTQYKHHLDQLVLWEPIQSGASYLSELRARERRKLGDLLDPPSWWRSGNPEELLGHAISKDHLLEIESLDLAQNAIATARRTTVITRTLTAHHQRLADAFRKRGVEAALEEVEDAGARFRDDGMLLAGTTIAHITGKLKAA